MDYSKIDNSGIWVKKGFKIDVTRIVDLWRNKIESKCNSVGLLIYTLIYENQALEK